VTGRSGKQVFYELDGRVDAVGDGGASLTVKVDGFRVSIGTAE